MDKVKAVKAQLRLQQWAERISECQASSMTVVAWCEAHDINVKTYYYWLRKVREATVENLPVSAMHIPAEAHQEPAHFKKLEVQSTLPGMQAAVIIHLPQAIVEVTSGTDQQTVEAVLMALKSVC